MAETKSNVVTELKMSMASLIRRGHPDNADFPMNRYDRRKHVTTSGTQDRPSRRAMSPEKSREGREAAADMQQWADRARAVKAWCCSLRHPLYQSLTSACLLACLLPSLNNDLLEYLAFYIQNIS